MHACIKDQKHVILIFILLHSTSFRSTACE